MTFAETTPAETVGIAVISGFAVALCTWLGHFLTTLLQRGTERIRFVREQLNVRYAEFVAAATLDIERAKDLEAAVAIGGENEATITQVSEAEARRHEFRRELRRRAASVRLLEPKRELADLVVRVVNGQPFMAFPVPSAREHIAWMERFDKYRGAVREYERLVDELVNAVMTSQTSRFWFHVW